MKHGHRVKSGTIIGEYVGELKTEGQLMEETSYFGENSVNNQLYYFPLNYARSWTQNDDGYLMIDASK